MAKNLVILEGLIATPNDKIKAQQTTNGNTFMKFTLAVKRKSSDANDYINITCWNEKVDYLQDYDNLQGRFLAIEGSIQTSTWKARDGRTMFDWTVNANEIYINPQSLTESYQKNKKLEPATSQEREYAKVEEENTVHIPSNEYDISDDDLPF